MSAQRANKANLWAEESWAGRTKNGVGSGWCGSAFSKFPAQLSYCVFYRFTDFRSTFDNFTPLVSVLRQIFQGRYWNISWKPSVCLWSAFSDLLGSAFPEIVRRRAVSSEGGDVSCGQYDRPNEAVITSRWCRCWEEKPELKLLKRTTARYTLILVASEMPLRFNTILLSRPKAALAFTSLVFLSLSTTIDFERVLPR